MLNAHLSHRVWLKGLPSHITLKQLGNDIAVLSGTLVWHCATHPVTWLCLAWLCLTMILPQNPVFSPVPGKAPFRWWLPPESEVPEWSLSASLQREDGKGADQGEGERQSLLSLVTYDLHHQDWQHFNTTRILQLRTQMALPTMSRESLVSGWVHPYLFYE